VSIENWNGFYETICSCIFSSFKDKKTRSNCRGIMPNWTSPSDILDIFLVLGRGYISDFLKVCSRSFFGAADWNFPLTHRQQFSKKEFVPLAIGLLTGVCRIMYFRSTNLLNREENSSDSLDNSRPNATDFLIALVRTLTQRCTKFKLQDQIKTFKIISENRGRFQTDLSHWIDWIQFVEMYPSVLTIDYDQLYNTLRLPL